MTLPRLFKRIEDTANWIESEWGTALSIATPLGLGKPNQLLNSLYRRAKNDPTRKLKIFTALSLHIPVAKSTLEKKFLDPFKERHFGKDYPELEYAKAVGKGTLAPNVEIHEFYFQAGKEISKYEMQRNYISLNYTHVAQSVFEHQIQVLLCLVAKNPSTGTYSLSSNPDLTLDLVDVYKKNGKTLKVVGVVHPDLPFMTEDAEVKADFFSAIVESDEVKHELFALPRVPIENADYLIGLQASLLLQDGGTIQVGIGSLSDAMIYCTVLRQKQPEVYRKITDELLNARFHDSPHRFEFQQGMFTQGLYGTSEMVMDAFMHLRQAGVLKREVYDADTSIRRYLHGAFFLGSKEFYRWMRARYEERDTGLCMTRVSKVNDLYDAHELALRRQRTKARFYNMAMSVSILGEAASDTLPNAQVVSGVGGQYNFVAMSHELPDSHSVIMLKSTHKKGKYRVSNIVAGHEHITIPRHLRDVFITEYGIAFTRGLSDEKVIRSIIEIADSQFQDELIELAVRNGKLSRKYKIPERAKNHSPERITKILEPYQAQGLFKPFPFGSDFTPIEERLVFALGVLKNALPYKARILALLFQGMSISSGQFHSELSRMELSQPKGFLDWVYQKLLLAALHHSSAS